MKKVIIRFLLIVFIVSCFSTGYTFAQESTLAAEPKLQVNYSENTFKVTGVAGENDRYILEILVGDITHQAADDAMSKQAVTVDGVCLDGTTVSVSANKLDAQSKLAYLKQFTASDNGSFEIAATITQTNTYSVILKNVTTGDVALWKVDFTASADYAPVIALLNSKITNREEFVALFTDANRRTLGFENGLNIHTEQAARLYFNTLNGTAISADDYLENTELWNECCAIVALNNGTCDNVAEYINGVVEENATIKKWYDNYIKTENDEKALTAGMKNKGITSVDDLETKLIESLILKVVEAPNGYLNIKNIMSDFQTILEPYGLRGVSQDLTVYTSLGGKTYSGIAAFLAAYHTNLNSDIVSDTGSLGVTSGVAVSGVGSSGEPQPTLAPINKDIFTDIANVPWAKEAILTLKLKGVINGKTDTTFSPNDLITREEFTKLIAAAVAFDAPKADIQFADANPALWYYPYLQQAKAAGIINGISNDYFGVGQSITRQDMAVIIYNAAKYKEVIGNATPDDFPFGDDTDISEYAKEAVYTLKTMKIINGVDSVNFAPLANATRAEAAVMIYRLLLK